MDDYCQSQLRWQPIGPERSGRTNDRRHHYWPHHSGVFIFKKEMGIFFHFNQAREWDGVLRLRRFDYNIYIRAEWPVAVNHGSYLSTSLLFCCQCSSISVFTACCVLKFCQTLSLSGTFLQISQRHLREIIWTHDTNDRVQNNAVKLNQECHDTHSGGKLFARGCEVISAFVELFYCQCFLKLPRRKF